MTFSSAGRNRPRFSNASARVSLGMRPRRSNSAFCQCVRLPLRENSRNKSSGTSGSGFSFSAAPMVLLNAPLAASLSQAARLVTGHAKADGCAGSHAAISRMRLAAGISVARRAKLETIRTTDSNPICARHGKRFFISGISKKKAGDGLRLLPAALFVFLAAAAGAWVVAADFRAGADGLGLGLAFHRLRGFADHVAGFGLSAAGSGAGAAERAGVLVQGLLRRVAEKIFKDE